MENNGFNVNINSDDFDLMTADENYKNSRFKKKKRGISGWWKGLKKWQKITLSTVTAFVAVILVLAIVFFSFFGYNYNKITTNPDDLGFENVINKKIVNVALFGIDTRDTKSFKGNSDSIMVLSINTEAKTVKIVSIMRDSLVKINNKGRIYYNKINSAYASGGPELAIKTINQNFGLDISEYATVNFFGMAEIIDAVGGIDVELTKQEVSTNHSDGLNGLIKRHCNKLGINPEPYYIRTEGKHHVNGIQAVAYSRIRKFINIWGTNNDFGRTDRQRYVMEQLFNKALTLPKSKYVKLVKALIPYTETSLSYSEIMGLAFDVLLDSPTFEQTRMPLSEYQMKAPSISRVGSCVYYDLDFAKNLLYAFFYENITPEDYVKANGIGKNDWYRNMFGSSDSSGTSSNTGSQEEPTESDLTTSDTPSIPDEDIPSVPEEGFEDSDLTPPLDTESSSDMESSSEEVPSGEQIPSDEQQGSQGSSTEDPPTTSQGGTSSDNTTTQ